uniref:Uncharacterized protein n=1 Tax=Rhizophora mucronata TaxID=61149 RepID=A0A2P2PZA1_RHIMU
MILIFFPFPLFCSNIDLVPFALGWIHLAISAISFRFTGSYFPLGIPLFS